MKTLRDAVHGDIRLKPEEVAVLDTPPMQRLRGIRQLGAAYLVYPAAQHSRFEHSIGTCHMARRLMAAIEERGEVEFSPTERSAVCLAALVHDVTHVPFGHTFEDERSLLARHDEDQARYRHFLESGRLGQRLESTKAGRLAKKLVAPESDLDRERRYLRDIVDGTICADLLDYLKRDNYFCGLRQEFDERVFRYFTVHGGRLALDMVQDGLFRRDALSEITNLLRIRYVLSERVYYHHAKIAAGAMISKLVELARAAGMEQQELYGLTDDSLIHYIRHTYGGRDGIPDVVDALRDRRLYKRCYLLTRGVGEHKVEELVTDYHGNRNGARTAAERRIAAELGLPEHAVAIYCAPAEMALKEAEVPARMGGGRIQNLAELNSEEIRLLKQQHRALWSFYVFIDRQGLENVDEAGRACEEVIGPPNELPRQMKGEKL